MTEEIKAKAPKQMMTPLWVISPFVSLTEVVTGVAVIKATGGVQIALTTFVVTFPVLVASAFFATLWFRPYVFYPPTEFAGGVDVTQYVNAMKPKVDSVRADLQAEVANVRASLDLAERAYQQRIEEIEGFLADFAKERKATQEAFNEYKKSVSKKLIEEERDRFTFEQKSRFRVHLVSVNRLGDSPEQIVKKNSWARQLSELGYRTSVGWWNADYFLSGYKEGTQWASVRIISPTGKNELAQDLKAFLEPIATVPIEIISDIEANKKSNKNVFETGHLPEDVDVIIAYCTNDADLRLT